MHFIIKYVMQSKTTHNCLYTEPLYTYKTWGQLFFLQPFTSKNSARVVVDPNIGPTNMLAKVKVKVEVLHLIQQPGSYCPGLQHCH